MRHHRPNLKAIVSYHTNKVTPVAMCFGVFRSCLWDDSSRRAGIDVVSGAGISPRALRERPLAETVKLTLPLQLRPKTAPLIETPWRCEWLSGDRTAAVVMTI